MPPLCCDTPAWLLREQDPSLTGTGLGTSVVRIPWTWVPPERRALGLGGGGGGGVASFQSQGSTDGSSSSEFLGMRARCGGAGGQWVELCTPKSAFKS